MELATLSDAPPKIGEPFPEMAAAHLLAEMVKTNEAGDRSGSLLTTEEVERLERFYGKVDPSSKQVKIRRLLVDLRCGFGEARYDRRTKEYRYEYQLDGQAADLGLGLGPGGIADRIPVPQPGARYGLQQEQHLCAGHWRTSTTRRRKTTCRSRTWSSRRSRSRWGRPTSTDDARETRTAALTPLREVTNGTKIASDCGDGT